MNLASRFAAIGLIVLSACSGGPSQSPVPRPRAYARIPLYEARYAAPADCLPLAFEANAAATMRRLPTDSPHAVWVDIRYPAYRGVLHVTFTRAADSARRADVIANRLERIALNLGDVAAEQLSLEAPSGYVTSLMRARGASPVPLQFISASTAAADVWVVSGSFEFDRLPSAVDSVKPVVDAVEADIIHAATNLR